MKTNLLLTACLALAITSACRQDMHDQPKYRPFAASTFFPDGLSARMPVDGAVARGQLRDNGHLYLGRVANDKAAAFATTLPMPVTKQLIERGQQRFNIYCSPCHGLLGDGEGMVPQRGFKHPPSYHTDRLRKKEVGYIFDVITNGFGVMLSYGSRVPVEDRWAIVSYIRALQLSRNATIDDVPVSERPNLDRKVETAAAPAHAKEGGH